MSIALPLSRCSAEQMLGPVSAKESAFPLLHTEVYVCSKFPEQQKLWPQQRERSTIAQAKTVFL